MLSARAGCLIVASPGLGLEFQLMVLARRLTRSVRLRGPSGFTVLDRSAYQALWRICDEGPVRPTTLAGQLGVHLSVVSRQVQALVEAGFVQREDDPDDARATLIRVTGAGRDAFQEAQRSRTLMLDEVLSSWPEEDSRRFVVLLRRFNEQIEAEISRRQADLDQPPEG